MNKRRENNRQKAIITEHQCYYQWPYWVRWEKRPGNLIYVEPSVKGTVLRIPRPLGPRLFQIVRSMKDVIFVGVPSTRPWSRTFNHLKEIQSDIFVPILHIRRSQIGAY